MNSPPRHGRASTCAEAADAAEPEPLTPGRCQECAELGESTWAHLRMCLTCGHVGCCDSSPHQHANRALPRDRAPGHAFGRAGRELAVVLRRHPAGLTVWQGGQAMTESTEPTTERRSCCSAPATPVASWPWPSSGSAPPWSRVERVRRRRRGDGPARRAPAGLRRRRSPRTCPPTVLIAAAERDVRRGVPDAARHPARRSIARGCASWPADELGLPTVPFWFAGSAEELAAVAEHAGFPLVVTPLAGAVDRRASRC